MGIETMRGATLALYNSGVREGLQKGRKKGLLKGEKNGLQKGRQEGLLEGRAATLLRILDLRFQGKVSALLRERINNIKEIEKLDSLLDFALDCSSADALEAKL